MEQASSPMEPNEKNNVSAGEENTLEESPRDIHGVKWFITLTAILSTTLLFSIDTTIVADVQSSIITDFDEVSKLAWLGAAFALGSAATILPWSKSYSVLNVKWLYIFHVILFETGSAICGGAPSMNALIVGRTIAGLGSSGMYVGCLTYISILTTTRERPIYIGLTGLVWGVGTILGPVLGGAIIDRNATWRWAFYLNLVVGAVFSPVYIFILPSVELQKDKPLLQRLKYNIDWFGNVVFIGSMCCLILAITFGGTVFPWNSASEIVLWVVSGALMLVFCFSQWYHPFVDARYKLYPTKFITRPTLVMLQIASFMSSVGLLIPTYYIPLFFQFTKDASALASAVHLLPFVIMVVLFALTNGALMAKVGYPIPWYLFGGVLVLIGSALMHTISSKTSSAAIYGYTTLIGAGVGSFLQAGFGITQVLVEAQEASDAVGFISLGQSMGIVVSLAIAGAVFENEAFRKVLVIMPNVDRSTLRQGITGTDSSYFTTLSTTNRTRVLDAVVSALGSVYIVVMVAGAFVLVIACLLPRKKLFTTG